VRIGAEIESVAASTKAAKVVNSEREEDLVSFGAPFFVIDVTTVEVRTPEIPSGTHSQILLNPSRSSESTVNRGRYFNEVRYDSCCIS
jgi:hypothetical protein